MRLFLWFSNTVNILIIITFHSVGFLNQSFNHGTIKALLIDFPVIGVTIKNATILQIILQTYDIFDVFQWQFFLFSKIPKIDAHHPISKDQF